MPSRPPDRQPLPSAATRTRAGRTRTQVRLAAILLTLVTAGASIAGPASAAPVPPVDEAATALLAPAATSNGLNTESGRRSRIRSTARPPPATRPPPSIRLTRCPGGWFRAPAPSRPCSTRRPWPTRPIPTRSRRAGESPSATRRGRGDGWSVGGSTPRALPGRQRDRRPHGDRARRGACGRAARRPVWPPTPEADASPGATSEPRRRAGSRPVAGDPLVAAAPEPDVAAPDAVAKGLKRQVFGFLPYWTLADKSTVLNYDYLSTIAYFSVGADRLRQPAQARRQRQGRPRAGAAGRASG